MWNFLHCLCFYTTQCSTSFPLMGCHGARQAPWGLSSEWMKEHWGKSNSKVWPFSWAHTLDKLDPGSPDQRATPRTIFFLYRNSVGMNMNLLFQWENWQTGAADHASAAGHRMSCRHWAGPFDTQLIHCRQWLRACARFTVTFYALTFQSHFESFEKKNGGKT